MTNDSKMRRRTAQDFHPRILEIFDGYVHGKISKREFMTQAGRYAAAGVTGAMLLDQLKPNYALAEQVSFNDPDIVGQYVTYPSPNGHGEVRGYLVRPAGTDDLPLPAVNQQQIRPSAVGAICILFQQALKTTGQHLFHHAKIVAGGQVDALDVEFTVLVFVEPVRACHDHCADGMRTLDVRVVVDLDPVRGFFHTKRFCHAFQQAGLGCGFRHLASKAFAGIA